MFATGCPLLFSSARLPFLAHPDYTDLAPDNPRLTSRLRGDDVIHTIDGIFAAARTGGRGVALAR